MSLYDNFHAPQYVDFMNLQNYDASDSSAFFGEPKACLVSNCHSLASCNYVFLFPSKASNHDPTLTDNNDGCNSSMSSASSEDERTLTPGHCGSVMSESLYRTIFLQVLREGTNGWSVPFVIGMSSDDSMSSVLAAPYKDDQVTGGLTSTPFVTSPKCRSTTKQSFVWLVLFSSLSLDCSYVLLMLTHLLRACLTIGVV